jgi:phospholipase/carboxylesterase
MTGLLDLDGPRYGAAAGEAQQLVVLLHGLGADGHDLIALAPMFAQRLPQAAFVSPDAPFPCDMAPVGRQWFSFQDASPEAILGGVRLAAPVLNAFLDAELARHGLGDGQLVLAGFSQGTMMALYVALRRPAACACVLGYSGALIGAELLAGELKSRPPVLLLHGDADQVVPPGALPAAVAALEALGVPVTSELRPGLGHGIDERGLQLGTEFLVRHLP